MVKIKRVIKEDEVLTGDFILFREDDKKDVLYTLYESERPDVIGAVCVGEDKHYSISSDREFIDLAEHIKAFNNYEFIRFVPSNEVTVLIED